MAEAAGLAVGVVALASLFTTCIECIEYLELKKSYKYDYRLACVKLSLLKFRLETWGQALGIDYGDGEDQGLQEYWSDEAIDVIHRSLRSIADILGDAQLLETKYSLVPRKSPSIQIDFIHKTRSPTFEDKHISSRRGPDLLSFRRSTTWAIRDKHRFDGLIDDLGFLISNIESVSLRLQASPVSCSMPCTARKTDGPQAVIPSRTTNHTFAKENPAVQCLPASPTQNLAVATTDVSERLQEVAAMSDQGSTTSAQAPQVSHSANGNLWKAGSIEGNAKVIHGQAGADTKPAPPGQTVTYAVGKVKDNADYFGGSISDNNFKDFFKRAPQETGSREKG